MLIVSRSMTQTQKITYTGAQAVDKWGLQATSLAATQKEIFVGGEVGPRLSNPFAERVIRYRI